MLFASSVSLMQAAEDVGCSPSHLSRRVTAESGLSMHQYVTSLRLAEAVNALRSGCTDPAALALRLGFSSHSHFTATFRRMLSAPPGDVRAAFASTSSLSYAQDAASATRF